MSKHFADSIYILTTTPERAEEVKSSITLRGLDQVQCLPLNEVEIGLKTKQPDLLIIDPEGNHEQGAAIARKYSNVVPTVYMADDFEEELFLTCHDAGVRDFLIKPINNAYLISRIFTILDEKSLEIQLKSYHTILQDLGVIGRNSDVFSTEYFIKHLKTAVQEIENSPHNLLTLVLVEVSGFDPKIANTPGFKGTLYRTVSKGLNDCSRGADFIGEYFENKFGILLPKTDLQGGKSVATRILKHLDNHPLEFEGHQFSLRVCVGIADYEGCNHYEDLINRAFDMLRNAKKVTVKLS